MLGVQYMEKKGFPFKKYCCTLYKSLQSDIRSGRRGFPKFTKFLWNKVWIIGGSDGKKSACNAGDPGSIPGLGRAPGEGNSNPLQYSCLGNPMDGGAWQATVHWVANSQPQLSAHTHTQQPVSIVKLFRGPAMSHLVSVN